MKTLIFLCFGLFLLSSCTKEEPTPIQSGYQFYCVQDSVSPGNICYFQVCFGDSSDGVQLLDIDTTIIIGQTGEAPRDILTNISLRGKYCQMYCFYLDCSYNFLSAKFVAKKGQTVFCNKCTNGITTPFLITE